MGSLNVNRQVIRSTLPIMVPTLIQIGLFTSLWQYLFVVDLPRYNLYFTKQHERTLYVSMYFKNSKLGQLYQSIPWGQLCDCLPPGNRGSGAPRWFSSQGMLGLMFVKAYLNLSDEKLTERFNTDWGLQLFCGKLLSDNQQTRDKAIVSRVRSYLAGHADWQQRQGMLINHWKRDMDNPCVTDGCHLL